MIDDALRPWLLEVNCSPALGCECAADREVKEPLISDLVDLLNVQRGNASNKLPAGGGARAVKARGWPARAEGEAQRRRGTAEAEAAGPVTAARRARLGGKPESVAPSSIGGYELIFPFNPTTERLANNVGGNEAQIVAEVRAELQRATGGRAGGGAGGEQESSADPDGPLREASRREEPGSREASRGSEQSRAERHRATMRTGAVGGRPSSTVAAAVALAGASWPRQPIHPQQPSGPRTGARSTLSERLSERLRD